MIVDWLIDHISYPFIASPRFSITKFWFKFKFNETKPIVLHVIHKPHPTELITHTSNKTNRTTKNTHTKHHKKVLSSEPPTFHFLLWKLQVLNDFAALLNHAPPDCFSIRSKQQAGSQSILFLFLNLFLLVSDRPGLKNATLLFTILKLRIQFFLSGSFLFLTVFDQSIKFREEII